MHIYLRFPRWRQEKKTDKTTAPSCIYPRLVAVAVAAFKFWGPPDTPCTTPIFGGAAMSIQAAVTLPAPKANAH
jgi:hypothetical protein